MRSINELCDVVRQTAYAIHVFHGHGHLEKVCENALAHRLMKLGLAVEQQRAITVVDEDGTVIGEYFSDLVIESRLIVELKACRTLAPEHEAQVLGYLKSIRWSTIYSSNSDLFASRSSSTSSAPGLAA